MRFCTTCGKEVAPGKKFCEYCGAPLEQSAPAVPASPAAAPAPVGSPPATPVAPSGGSGKTLVIAGIIVVLVLIAGAYVIGLPLISGSPSAGSALPRVTTLQTQPQVLYPTTSSAGSAIPPVTTAIPAAGLTYDDRYMETYTLVYSVDREFTGGQKLLLNQDLTTPPLYIKFNITPDIHFEEKLVDIGLHSERMVNSSYPSPDAWFTVKIYDADNGSLVEEQGFNRQHSVTTKQEFMVRTPGNYRVEMSGNEVFAEVRILTGKTS